MEGYNGWMEDEDDGDEMMMNGRNWMKECWWGQKKTRDQFWHVVKVLNILQK